MIPRSIYAAALVALGCSSAPLPCAGASGCPRGFECLASRCAVEGGAPVPAQSRRVRWSPSGLALASREAAQGMPATVTLGRDADAPRALYLRFPQRPLAGTKVRAAFLVLEPQSGTVAGDDVLLEVWRAAADWQGTALGWSTQPGFSPPFARAIARAAPALPVRFDVTELVQFMQAHPNADFGFAVRALGNGEFGIALATGSAGGTAPHLDVYVDD